MTMEYQTTDKDAVVAAVAAKAIEFMRATGGTLAKVVVKEADPAADASVFVQAADGRVLQAYVRDRLPDGRQFIDYEIHSTATTEYEGWQASGLANFENAIDEDIRKVTGAAARLEQSRRDTSESLYESYDFSWNVEAANGWETEFDGAVRRRVVFLTPDERRDPTIRAEFVVRFEDGSAVPYDVVAMLDDGTEFGNIGGGDLADYVVEEEAPAPAMA